MFDAHFLVHDRNNRLFFRFCNLHTGTVFLKKLVFLQNLVANSENLRIKSRPNRFFCNQKQALALMNRLREGQKFAQPWQIDTALRLD